MSCIIQRQPQAQFVLIIMCRIRSSISYVTAKWFNRISSKVIFNNVFPTHANSVLCETYTRFNKFSVVLPNSIPAKNHTTFGDYDISRPKIFFLILSRTRNALIFQRHVFLFLFFFWSRFRPEIILRSLTLKMISGSILVCIWYVGEMIFLHFFN